MNIFKITLLLSILCLGVTPLALTAMEKEVAKQEQTIRPTKIQCVDGQEIILNFKQQRLVLECETIKSFIADLQDSNVILSVDQATAATCKSFLSC